jgi:hypothetical protein
LCVLFVKHPDGARRQEEADHAVVVGAGLNGSPRGATSPQQNLELLKRRGDNAARPPARGAAYLYVLYHRFMTDTDRRFITFHVPDAEFLRALGEASVRHGHLDHILRMTIKTLTGLSVQDALDATERDTSSMLRRRVRKLARQALGEGKALLALEAILERCNRAARLRNDLIHGLFAKELDGEEVVRHGEEWIPPPTKEKLEVLARDLELLVNQLNHERLHGFLAEALADRAKRLGR